MSGRIVLGVDSSTQSTKVEARDIDSGEVLASASARHPATSPPVSEHDPRVWWHALVEACAQLGDLRSDVAAMSVAGQQHGLVVLDADGEPVRPAKLWNDTTSAGDAAALVDTFGAAQIAQLSGSVPVASFTVSKLAWLVANEPAALGKTTQILLPHDYLTWRLTGEHVTDRGDASGTGWFNSVTGDYVPEVLAAVDTSADWSALLPRVLGPTEAAGSLNADAAVALGLPQGVIVGPGTGDNMAGALGLGLSAGDLVMSLGTSGVAYGVSETPTHDESGQVAGFADASGRYLPLVCTLNATKVTDVVGSWLGLDAVGLDSLAGEADISTPSPVLVPYFDGERTPNLPDATGEIVGLTTSTTASDLALAAHDGVLCGLLEGIDALQSAGVAADGNLLLVGGGSRSGTYRQRLADLWGKEIVIPSTDETVAAGAAVQAAAVAGGTPLEDVQRDWGLNSGERIEPRAGVDGSEIRRRYREAAARIAAP